MGFEGVVREIARSIFDVDIVMKVTERKQESIDTKDSAEMEEHVVFKIAEVVKNGHRPTAISRSTLSLVSEFYAAPLQLTLRDFMNIFPYHICIDKNLLIDHCGIYVRKAYPFLITGETSMADIVDIVHPEIPMSYDNFIHFINGTFVFKMKQLSDIAPDKPDRAVQLKGRQ